MKLTSYRSWLMVGSVAFALTVPGRVMAAEKGKSGVTVNWGQATSASQPVDARYTAEGLRLAFADLCKKLRYRALRVEVDQSEFPFIVYGVLERRCDYRAIRDALRSMPDYAYSGSVTAVHPDGSSTRFALNMIPYDAYLRSGGKEAHERMIERLRELALSQP